MKKIFSLVALLLLCAFVLPSCAGTPTVGGDGSTEESTYFAPGEIYGIWHADDIGAVLEIREEEKTVSFYSLTTGYYEYYSVQNGTYTKENDNVLIFTLGDGNKSFVCAHDTTKDTLTVGEVTYLRAFDLPKEHPSYPFPDFAALTEGFDFSSVIEFPDYKSIAITDMAMDEARMAIFKSFYSSSLSDCPTITDRPAQRGDLVVVDYVGYKNGETFQSGSASDAEVSIIYNSGFIPGFAEGIIGHAVGESFDVEVTFPEDYHSADLAGQEVVFRMTLEKIYDVRLSAEQFDQLEGLEYETYEEYVTDYARTLSGSLAWTILTENSKLIGELPEESYLYFYQGTLDEMHYYAKLYGIEYKTFLSYYGYTEELFRAEAKKMAVGYVIPYLIAKAEGLESTEEEYNTLMDKFVKSFLNSYPDATKEEAKEQILKTQGKYFDATLMGDTVANWLESNLFVVE